MLSILIPIYAFDVTSFVKELHKQALLLTVDWEIILYDDGSPEEWKIVNRALSVLDKVLYKELDQNIGRAAIRNALATAASFDYLLFMDCDSETVSSKFLSNYIENLKPNTVLYGGRSYTVAPPKDQCFRLHWHYGSKREVRSLQERKNHAHYGFMTNNFVIFRDVFLRIKLDDRLKQYGHEDTLLGLKLEEEGITILHLDNPLLHVGLEKNYNWITKQKQAIQNLYWLCIQYPSLSTPVLRTWWFLKKVKLLPFIRPILKKAEPFIKENLYKSSFPKLWLFDLLKVLWLDETVSISESITKE